MILWGSRVAAQDEDGNCELASLQRGRGPSHGWRSAPGWEGSVAKAVVTFSPYLGTILAQFKVVDLVKTEQPRSRRQCTCKAVCLINHKAGMDQSATTVWQPEGFQVDPQDQ